MFNNRNTNYSWAKKNSQLQDIFKKRFNNPNKGNQGPIKPELQITGNEWSDSYNRDANNIISSQRDVSFNRERQNTTPVVSSFDDGLKVWGKTLSNDFDYARASLDKAASGEGHLKESINSLQGRYDGNLAGQSTDVLKNRMREITREKVQVPFPGMNPTHQLSLNQMHNPALDTEYDLLGKISKMKESGADENEINSFIDSLYTKGGEATQRVDKVLNDATKIPQTKGWATVGSVGASLSEAAIPIVASALNPALGFATSAATLGGAVARSMTQAQKEIDLHEKQNGETISPKIKNIYTMGVAASDLILGGLMQSHYLRNVDIPALSGMRKGILNKLVKNPGAMQEVNQLLKNSGKLAIEQGAASSASEISRNVLGLIYKKPDEFPEMSTILNDVMMSGVAGAAGGFVLGGLSGGVRNSIRGNNPSYKLNLPDEEPMFDLKGMTLREHLEKNSPEWRRLNQQNGGEYKLNLPDEKPMFDLKGMTLREHLEKNSPEWRRLNQQNGGEYKLNLPDEEPMFDLKGMTLREHLEKNSPEWRRLNQQNGGEYKLNLPDEEPMFDLKGMTLREHLEKNSPEWRRLNQQNGGEYKLNLPDEEPMFDLKGMTLREHLEKNSPEWRKYIEKKGKKENYNFNLQDDNEEYEPINMVSRVLFDKWGREIPQKHITWGGLNRDDRYSDIIFKNIIANWGDKLKFKTNAFKSFDDIPLELRKHVESPNSKGFFNPDTQEVGIIAKNITDENDLKEVILHNGYVGKGLSSVLGNDIDDFYDEIYNNMSNRVTNNYPRDFTQNEIVKAHLADLANDPNLNPEEWRKISSFLKDMIRVKSDGNIVSDETLRRMLWQNNNQITGDDSIEDMVRKSISKFRIGDDEYAKLNQNTNTYILP